MEDDENSINSNNEEEAPVGNESDDNDEYTVDDDTWVEWFCKLEGNHFFCEINDEFLNNPNHIPLLSKKVPNFK